MDGICLLGRIMTGFLGGKSTVVCLTVVEAGVEAVVVVVVLVVVVVVVVVVG